MKCAACETDSLVGWSDLYGEAYCHRCGTPHQVKGEGAPRCNLKDDFIPIVKEYFTQTGKSCGLLTVLVDGLPEYATEMKARAAFSAWMQEKHPELCLAPAGETP